MDMNEINRLLLNLIRKGTILAVDKALCRFTSGDLETNWLPWLAPAAGETIEWNPPEVGEQVVLLSPGGDPACGFVLRGLYADDHPPPSTSPTTHTRRYADGAMIEYDHASHQLVATLPEGAAIKVIAPVSVTVETETVLIKADTITLDAGTTHCTGQLDVDGDVNAENVNATQVTANGIPVDGHAHMDQGDFKRGGPAIK